MPQILQVLVLAATDNRQQLVFARSVIRQRWNWNVKNGKNKVVASKFFCSDLRQPISRGFCTQAASGAAPGFFLRALRKSGNTIGTSSNQARVSCPAEK